MKCSLCAEKINLFFTYEARKSQRYYQCTNCHSILLHPDFYISSADEKARYLTHNNDVEDPGYRKFVSPVVQAVLNDFEAHHRGLDFGAGTGPVITHMLEDHGYQLTTYDPFFIPDSSALDNTYDYIVCCEVIEHFHDPHKEFKKLKSLLKTNGVLYLKTDLYSEETDFENWSYKDDETHTFFYHADALRWIQQHIGFSRVGIQKNLIVLNK